MPHSQVIIPVAAGKGGIGKSFVSANLAIALARRGHRTLAIDLDLGGSNMHSFFGLPNRYPGIGDYLLSRSVDLEALQVSCGVDNLTFIPGDGKTPFMANLHTARKLKLIRRIRKLPADYIVMDLGAGTSFNTLDFFRMADRGLLVTSADYLAIMNLLVFTKALVLRHIERELAANRPVRNLLRELFAHSMEAQIPSIQELKKRIAQEDPQAVDRVDSICAQLRPRVLFNFGRSVDDLKAASNISQGVGKILSMDVDFFGFIYEDSTVNRALALRQPFLTAFPDAPAALNIMRIAERIEKYWHKNVADSADRIRRSVEQSPS